MKRKGKRIQQKETPTSRMERINHKPKGNSFTVAGTVLKVFAVIVLLLSMGGINYAAKMLAEATSLANDAYKPRSKIAKVNGKEVDLSGISPSTDPFTILILGIDDNKERSLGTARTDSMLLATVNPKTGSISMVSIPRDSYVDMDFTKYKGKAKINSAYTYDKEDGSIQAVQDLLNIPINYYVTLDFNAFEDIIDSLGGVEIDVPFTLTEQNAKGKKVVSLTKGKHVLDGTHALAFARTRYVDNDIERGRRQQQVLQAAIKKATSVGSIGKFSDIIKALKGHLWTDMDMDTMLSIVQSGLSTSYKFTSYTFEWTSANCEAGSVVLLYGDSLDYVSHKLRVNLGLDQTDERDAKGYKFKTDGVISQKTYIAGYTGESQTVTTGEEYQAPTSNVQTTQNNQSIYNNNQGTAAQGSQTTQQNQGSQTNQAPQTNQGQNNTNQGQSGQTNQGGATQNSQTQPSTPAQTTPSSAAPQPQPEQPQQSVEVPNTQQSGAEQQ